MQSDSSTSNSEFNPSPIQPTKPAFTFNKEFELFGSFDERPKYVRIVTILMEA